MVNFFTDGGKKPLPYDPWTPHPITIHDLESCAKKEGMMFRQGDILLLRVGWMQKWYTSTPEIRDELAEKEEAA